MKLTDFRSEIRTATRGRHDDVDGIYSQFDLTDPAGYAAFLHAQARALIPLECWLEGSPAFSFWTARAPMLCQDLAEMGYSPPAALVAVTLPRSEATLWGVSYVMEGSRLGGKFLARGIPASLPTSFLTSTGKPWPKFLDAMNLAALAGGEMWRRRAIAAAHACFGVFTASAEQQEEAA